MAGRHLLLSSLSCFIWFLKVSRRLTLIWKGIFCPLRLLPLMTEFSVFMPHHGIAPGNSWLGGVSLKDYRIIWKWKSNNTLRLIGTTDKMERDGRNETLYRCRLNYVLSKLIVDNDWRIYGESKTQIPLSSPATIDLLAQYLG